MNNLGDKYICRAPNRIGWRFEVTANFRTAKHSYSKIFTNKAEALAYRDKWLAGTHWLDLGAAARAKILINGGARAGEVLDIRHKRTNNQTHMDSGYIYDQLTRQERAWSDCLRRTAHLEAQLSALIERIYALEREVDAINARRNARTRAAAKKTTAK